MSSALLYLAIVCVWGVVLVPMWLRRESTAHGTRGRLFTRRRTTTAEPDDTTYDEDLSPTAAHGIVADAETETMIGDGTADPEPARTRAPARRRPEAARRRARVIARRRRRTTILLTLIVATLALAATHIASWWTALVPTLLLVGHLALLRAAATADAQRARAQAAREAARARHRATARATEETALEATLTAPSAEIIDFAAHTREEIYDQYADAEKRAVND